MRKETKIEVGKKIRSIIDSHKGLFFFEYGKMSVQESLELRRAIRKHSTSGIRIVKNTFVKKAIGDDTPSTPNTAEKSSLDDADFSAKPITEKQPEVKPEESKNKEQV